MYRKITSPFAGMSTSTPVHRDLDGAMIPADPRNVDWQAYQAWLAAGHVAVDADPRPATQPTETKPVGRIGQPAPSPASSPIRRTEP